MASTENKRIIEIETRQEGTTLADLKIKVDEAAEALRTMEREAEEMTEGGAQLVKRTDEYQNALVELKKAQGDYNTEMRMSVKEAAATKGSYNDLVNELNRLKEEWKSAELGSEKFNEITAKVAEVKDQLKDYDATIGNFQRNVGNYAMEANRSVEAVNARWKAGAETMNTFKDSLEKGAHASQGLKGAVENTGQAMKLMATNPLMGVLQLLAPLISQIAAGLKENEQALGAVNKLMEAFKPVGDMVTKVVTKLANIFSRVVDSVVEFAARNKETFGGLVAGAVGAGNAVLQYLLTPFRTLIDAAKGVGQIFKDIFTGDFKSIGADARAAGEALGEDFRKGFSFKANFEEGKELGEALMARIGSSEPTKKAAEQAGEALGEKVAEAVGNGFARKWDAIIADIERKAEDARRQMEASLKEWETLSADESTALFDDVSATLDGIQQEILDGLRNMADGSGDAFSDMGDDAEAYAKGVGNVLNSAAGAYESLVENQVSAGKMTEAEGQKAFQRVKGVQYASAIINALLSANEAYSSLASIPYVGPALGAAAAAASLATGIATAGQIASTSIGGAASAASAAASTYQSVNTTAPIAQEVVQTTRIVTNEQDTQAFADALGSQKVYVLQSDIEAANGAHKVAVTESSF